jgi:putative endonuclease
MSNPRAALGRRWESAAAEFLQSHGLAVIERGYRCRLGELDLICRDGETLVLVEVRARSAGAYVTAGESVDRAKQQRLIKTTRHFLMRHPRYCAHALRFDVLAIDNADRAHARIDWIKDAFQAG